MLKLIRAIAIAMALCVVTFVPMAQATTCEPTVRAPTSTVEMQFNFTVVPADLFPDYYPPSIWNGPGPMPTTLQETFFVDPASASGNWSSIPTQTGALLDRINETFTASDMTLTANGQVLQSLASGSFRVGGDGVGYPGPGRSFFGFVEIPNGGGGANVFTNFAQAPPDWAAFLSTSHYCTDISPFTISGSFGTLDVFWSGGAVPSSVSVPEPGSLALFALAGLALLWAHRDRPGMLGRGEGPF